MLTSTPLHFRGPYCTFYSTVYDTTQQYKQNDCTSNDPAVKLLKFADDTTVIGLIQDGDESAYRREVGALVQSEQLGAENAQDCGDDSGF